MVEAPAGAEEDSTADAEVEVAVEASQEASQVRTQGARGMSQTHLGPAVLLTGFMLTQPGSVDHQPLAR